MSFYFKIVVFLVLLIFASALRASLVAEYFFEEGSGTATGDTGGSGNNGYLSGDVTWVSGCNSSFSKYALNFSGSDYVVVDDSASLDTITGGFSLTAWIKVASGSTTSTVVSKLGALRVWVQNANLMVTLEGVPNVANYQLISGQIPDDTWVHIAVTYSGTYIAGYVNGTRMSNVRVNNSSVPITMSNYPLLIGLFGSTYYRGSMDNMRLYSHGLSSTEVTADMNRIGFFSSVSLTVVQSGIAKTAIIVPDGALEEVITVAANELQYHIEKATGVTLQIYPESSKPTVYNGLIYVGRCNATRLAGIQGSNLDLNGYIARSFGQNFFLAGHDTFGAALGMLHTNRTQIGTMLAVYRFLEKYMGVKWLWPGVSGEVVPHYDELVLSNINIIGKPVMTNTNLIDYNPDWGWGANYYGWSSSSVQQAFLNDQSLWMRRQGFCQATDLTNSGHSMEDWWAKYGVSHPEYFSLLPDGSRRPDPLYWGGPGYLAAFCLSQPNVWKQIVDEWVAAGASGMIQCGMTDAPTVCTCASCMAWDVPDSDLTIQWADRLTYATNAFNSSDPGWYNYLGRMSDRYAKFILAVQQEAQSRGYTDAEVFGFAYTNRYKSPLQTQVNKQVTLGIVPAGYFPLTWNNENQQVFRDSWNGWAGTDGANALLRPNYFLSGHNMPIFVARRFGLNFIYALRRGMIATNFDSLTGQWASQAANFYMLARAQTHVDASPAAWGTDLNGDGIVDFVDFAMFSQQWLDDQVICLANGTCPDFNGDGEVDFVDFAELSNNWNGGCKDVEAILDDFYGAFGPAASAVRAYFDYWENVSDNTTIYGGYNEFYKTAPQIFTPTVMTAGRALMTQAQQAASGDAVAERLVGFLEKGLTHTEKTLDTEAAWEEYQRTGVVGPWTTALGNLDLYRASVESDGICNMGFLYWAETYNWR